MLSWPEKLKMSNPAAKERVRRLEQSGVIAGYRLELDPKAAGHEITAFVRIRPLPGHVPKISQRSLNRFPRLWNAIESR